eukprot:Skav200702  [mRNA]  locus=scaffold2650:12244:12823:- [translate_table: standard]
MPSWPNARVAYCFALRCICCKQSTLPNLKLFVLMLGSIICVRRLLQENASLKVDLQERTVELGAVSSLLTACYDAVLEVDDELKLTQIRGSSLPCCCLPQDPAVCAGKLFLDSFVREIKVGFLKGPLWP